MADYVVRVEASTEEAEKKLKRVDQQVVKLDKSASIDIKLPSAEQTLSTLGKIASATAEVGKQALAISRAANIGPGAVINDLDELFGIVSSGAKKSVSALELLKRSTPQNILGTAFNAATDQATALAQRISNVGYEIFGVTQSVGILRQAFNGLFDETIGREIRLQEALLRTRTTLASTADVAVDGKRITDPFKALVALEGPIEQTLQNIRRRSLDIAGTTSEAIVQVFGVVASQVGAFGGDLKDAEDLAITFAGALGTIGMADPMLATQEIRSILTGNIDQNSVLARSLGLTNDQIQKAKTSTEGLVGFLTRRLAAFTAGQKLAAQGFAGIVSNIQEVKEEALRSLGKPLLQPLLDSLTDVYERLQLVFDQILSIADGLGRVASVSFSGIVSGIKAAPVLQGLDTRAQIQIFDEIDQKIASLAVTVQNQLDIVRPLIASIANEALTAIAMLGNGLGALLRGFAAFKWEQIKILAISISNIGEILNATVIPALNAILKLYGALLSDQVIQYLAQVGTTMKLLETVGIMPVVRVIGFIAIALLDSVKIFVGWVRTVINLVKRAVTAIKDTIANSIQGVTQGIEALGKAIISKVTFIVTSVIILVGRAISSLGQLLINFALVVQSQGPQYGTLATKIADIGRAFTNINAAAQSAVRQVQTAAQQMSGALNQVRDAGIRASQSVRTVGATIAAGLTSLAEVVGKRLLGMIGGLIVFQAKMLALQIVVGFVVDSVARLMRNLGEPNEKLRAAQALDRLTTSYKNLGDNASATARALKSLDVTRLNERAESLDKRIQEEADAYLAAQKKLSEGQRYIKRLQETETYGNVKPVGIGSGSQDSVLAEARKQIKQYEALTEERDRIRKYFEEQESSEQRKQDVQILARERKDIETAIGEYRKEIEKDLRDERFRTAQEVAKLEQSLVEERRRVERAELDRQLARQSEGLTGIQANLAQILGDYERGLFDAQTEAQRKQFEAVQARENLEKSVADYKLKLEEQTERMRKRMGEFNQKVVDYEAKQRERAAKKVLEYTIKAARVATTGYIPGPDDKRKFLDAVAGQGASAEKILSYLYAGGARNLGVQPGAEPKDIVAAVLSDPLFKRVTALAGKTSWESALNTMTKDTFGQSRAGTFAIQAARDDFALNQWYNKEEPAPKPVTGFKDLASDNEKFANERRVLGQQVQAAAERLAEVINVNNLKENYKATVAKLQSTTLFTDIPTERTAIQANQDLTRDLKLLNTALTGNSGKVDLLSQKLAELKTTALRAAEGFADFTPVIKELPGDVKKQIGENLAEIYKSSLDAGQVLESPTFNDFLMKLQLPKDKLKELGVSAADFKTRFVQMIKTSTITLVNAQKQIQAVAPILDKNERLATISRDLAAFNTENRNFVRNGQVELLEGFGQAAAGDSPLRQRGFEAEMINLRRTLLYSDSGLLQDPEGVKALQDMNDATRRSRQELGLFEESLKGTTQRIALIKDLAQTMVTGYRNMFMNLVQGGDIKQAFTDLAESIQERVVGAFMEYATRPIIDQMEKTLFQALRTPTPEELAQKQRDLLMETNNTALGSLNAAIINLNNTIKTTVGPHTGMGGPGPSHDGPQQGGWKIGGEVGQHLATPVKAPITKPPIVQIPSVPIDQLSQPWNFTSDSIQNMPEVLTSDFVNSQQPLIDMSALFTEQMQLSNESFKRITSSSKELPNKFNTLQKTLGGAIQGIAGVAMGLAGAQQMSGGGTYNTLMGLAGVFGAIGSIAGAFGSFASTKKRATGGPVSARMPYLVGEQGPELFVPSAGGQILNADRSQRLFNQTREAAGATAFASTRNAVAQQQAAARENDAGRALADALLAPADPLKVAFETTRINSVDYVTADQFRAGMTQSAERGRALTLAALKNSVKTRRMVGV